MTAVLAPALAAPANERRPQSIRGRLVALVLAMLLPMLCVTLVAGTLAYRDARSTVSMAALETAKALSLVVDREMAHRAGILKTLAASPSLDRGDFAAFYEQAKAVAPGVDTTVILVDPDGHQLLNTRVPLGTANLPRLMNMPPAIAPVTSMQVTDLYMAPLGMQYSFGVRVPVVRDGKVRWYVSMGSFATQLQRIFEQQPLPPGWLGTLVDRQGYVVARNLNPAASLGKRATDDMRERFTAAPQGMHETQTLDGTPVLTVFTRAPDSGWHMLIGLPRAQLREPALQALATIGTVSLLLTALGVVAARRVGRTITKPLERLQADAVRLGLGEHVPLSETGLLETDSIQRRLARASDDLRAADARLKEQVAEAVAETERAQLAAFNAQKLEALGRLTGGIAHDFNNLLQTMTMGIRLTHKLSPDERIKKAMDACDRAVDKGARLTRQLLTFGRAQPGTLDVVDLRDIAPRLRETLHGGLRESIELTLKVADDVHPVEMDPVQFELAVLNLVLNARDAIGDQGLVEVDISNAEIGEQHLSGLPAGEYVAVRVRDNGRGIPQALLPRVFEPFFTTKPAGEGGGLGLPQVYGFAKQLGGIATVQSVVGSGTQVAIYLPRSLRQPGPAISAPRQEVSTRYEGTVLLVEDDALARGLTAASLEELGFTVLVASNAHDALAIARSAARIDAVLSDVVMPGGKSGIDLAGDLARLRPGVPVVLATGYTDSAQDLPWPVIRKPCGAAEIAEMLARRMSSS
jgi:signal transduction histidine kinase